MFGILILCRCMSQAKYLCPPLMSLTVQHGAICCSVFCGIAPEGIQKRSGPPFYHSFHFKDQY